MAIGVTPSPLDRTPLPAGATIVAPAIADALTSQEEQKRKVRNVSRVGLTPLAGYGWAVQNSDFYGGIGNHPAQYQTSRVGAYGGDPIWVNNSTRLPFSVLASREQGVIERLQEVKDYEQKLANEFDPFGKIAKLKAPAYKEAYTDWGVGSVERIIEQAVQAHGGDRASAYAELNTPMGRQKYGLDRAFLDIADVATNIDATVDAAVKYKQEVAKNELLKIPGRTERADALIQGLSEAGTDPRKMARLREEFDDHMSLDRAWESSGMMEKLMAVITASEPDGYIDEDTGQIVTKLDHTSSYDALANQWADEWAKYYPEKETGISRMDLYDYARARLPNMVKRTMVVQAPPAPRDTPASQRAPGTPGASIQFAPIVEPIKKTTFGKGMERRTIETIKEIGIAENGVGTRPRDFRDKDNNEVYLTGVKYRKAGDEWYFVGKGYRRSGQKLLDGNGKELPLSIAAWLDAHQHNPAVSDDVYARFQMLPEITVPLRLNKDKNELYFNGFDPNSMISDEGGTAQPSTTPSSSKPATATQQGGPPTWEALQSKLPPGITRKNFDDLMKTPEGREWLKGKMK